MSEYTNKTREELTRLVAEHREKLRAFRFAMAGGKTKNVKEGKAVRKEIARLLTELCSQKSQITKSKSQTNPNYQNPKAQ